MEARRIEGMLKTVHPTMTDARVVLVMRVLDEIEITCDEPWADNTVMKISELIKEELFAGFIRRTINCGERSRGAARTSAENVEIFFSRDLVSIVRMYIYYNIHMLHHIIV